MKTKDVQRLANWGQTVGDLIRYLKQFDEKTLMVYAANDIDETGSDKVLDEVFDCDPLEFFASSSSTGEVVYVQLTAV